MPRAPRRGPAGPARRAAALWLAALALGLAPGLCVAQPAAGEETLADEAVPPPSSAAAPVAAPAALVARGLRGLRPPVVAQVLGGAPGGEIALELLALPRPAGDGPAAVPLLVEIDGGSFLEHNQADLARVELYVYALSPAGAVVDHLAEAFAVDVEQVGEAVWQSGLKYFGQLELPAGSYTLRVLVRNFQSRASGLAVLELTVPPAWEGARAGPLGFPPPPDRDRWVPVLGRRVGVEEPPDGEQEVAALPVVVAGRPAAGLLTVHGLAPGPIEGSFELVAEGVERATAGARGPLEVRRLGPAADGGERLSVELAVPELAPGLHRVRLALSDAAGARLAPPPTRLLVVDRATRERDLLWTDVRWVLSGPRPAVEPPPRRAKKRRRKVEPQAADRARPPLARAYREALGELAAGSAESARRRLFEVESRALGRSSGDPLLALRETELAVAAEVGRRGVEQLLPILALHDGMYETYRARRLFSLLLHTRQMVEALAELWVAHGGEPATAARALASQGGYLQEGNLPATSRRLFGRALEHDPASAVALLGLAVSYEKFGEYPAAIDQLERLVAIGGAPGGAPGEAALRLALNLGRVGSRLRQRQLLSRLIEPPAAGWVRAVAFQELARSHLETGEEGMAAELLERAVAELPEQAGSRVLLAHVYDRQGRAAAAVAALQGVAARPGSAPAARMLYDSWPDAALRAVRRALREAAGEALPAFGRELAEAGEASR